MEDKNSVLWDEQIYYMFPGKSHTSYDLWKCRSRLKELRPGPINRKQAHLSLSLSFGRAMGKRVAPLARTPVGALTIAEGIFANGSLHQGKFCYRDRRTSNLREIELRMKKIHLECKLTRDIPGSQNPSAAT